MKDYQPEVDLTVAGQHVDRAVRAAVPAGGMTQRKIRPESTITWDEPSPLAGLRAARAVADMAMRRAYDYVVKLRSEGTSWETIAGLLEIPYSDDYTRRERAYELVLGPAPEGSTGWSQRNLYWECGGPLGCGKYISDRGPYETYPEDNEGGHDDGCRRLQTETEAKHREMEERERRDAVSQSAYATITDPFDRETVQRCWWSLRRGGEIRGTLSTGEQLAVAIVLRDTEYLKRNGQTMASAIERVYECTPAQARRRLATLRAAATGVKA